MAKLARADLENVLRSRQLDRTLTSVLNPLAPGGPGTTVAGDLALSTGVPPLDRVLAGGLPRGELSEIAGPRSSGRTTLALQLIAAAARRGEIAALVDTFDRLDVTSTRAAGIDLARLLWVRGQAISSPLGPTDLRDRTLERAIKSAGLILQAGGFGVVVLDLADAPSHALRRLPMSTWLRLHRAIEGSDTACVLLVPEPLARSAGGLTVRLTARPVWTACSPHAGSPAMLAGAALDAHVMSPRRRVNGETTFTAAHPWTREWPAVSDAASDAASEA